MLENGALYQGHILAIDLLSEQELKSLPVSVAPASMRWFYKHQGLHRDIVL